MARLSIFIGTELGPDGQVLGDLQGLLRREVQLANHVQHAGAAGVLDRRAAVEEDVVGHAAFPALWWELR